jgi:FKBP-type peptidyl-prolyl cis-trans isomerase FklB
MKGTKTTPTFDTIEAQASYGIGLQVGQQLSESGLQGLLPEALVAGIADALEGKQPQVPVEAVHRALREIHERADAVRRERFQDGRRWRNTWKKTASAKA